MKDKKSIQFNSTILRNEIVIEVKVSASVYWTEAREDLSSGYVVEEIQARQAGPEIELTKGEIRQFEQEAIGEYLK